jgi:hypothetical protein
MDQQGALALVLGQQQQLLRQGLQRRLRLRPRQAGEDRMGQQLIGGQRLHAHSLPRARVRHP